MLDFVRLVLSLIASRLRDETDELAPHVTAGERPLPGRPLLYYLVPWFQPRLSCSCRNAFLAS